MKKFASIFSIALAAGLLASCTENFKDWSNPQSSDPETPLSTEVRVTPVAAIDFNAPEWAEKDEVAIFNSIVDAPQEATVVYQATLFNEALTKSYEIPMHDKLAKKDDVTSAVIKMAGTESVARTLPLKVVSLITVNGATVRHEAETTLTVTIVPIPVPEVWYISGNFVGNGTGSFLAESCVPMYPNHANYEEILFAGKLDANSVFYIYKQEGQRYPYFAKSKEDGSIIIVNSAADKEKAEAFKPELTGYYKITFNVKAMTIAYEPIECNAVYTAISIPGDYQGWDPSQNAMTPETTQASLECHDWSETIEIVNVGGGLKFCSNLAWGGKDWGGKTWPLGISDCGDNIMPSEGGKYFVIFNDIMGAYYFRAVE
ncbi:MAG: DUF5115 domain-containing protein [Muribaculaceae bacterium]|nr:DUF5115 domain-containing protein [Muribaculaceae bacterium]